MQLEEKDGSDLEEVFEDVGAEPGTTTCSSPNGESVCVSNPAHFSFNDCVILELQGCSREELLQSTSYMLSFGIGLISWR